MEGEVGKEVIQMKKSWSDEEAVKWNGGCKEQRSEVHERVCVCVCVCLRACVYICVPDLPESGDLGVHVGDRERPSLLLSSCFFARLLPASNLTLIFHHHLTYNTMIHTHAQVFINGTRNDGAKSNDGSGSDGARNDVSRVIGNVSLLYIQGLNLETVTENGLNLHSCTGPCCLDLSLVPLLNIALIISFKSRDNRTFSHACIPTKT